MTRPLKINRVVAAPPPSPPPPPPPPSSPVPIAAIAVTNRSRVSRTVCATTSTSSRVTLAPFARLKCTRMSDDDFNGARSIDRRSRRRDARGETTRDENRRGTTTTSVRSRVRGLARSRARASAGHAPTVAIGSRGRPRHVTDGDETIQVYIPYQWSTTCIERPNDWKSDSHKKNRHWA